MRAVYRSYKLVKFIDATDRMLKQKQSKARAKNPAGHYTPRIYPSQAMCIEHFKGKLTADQVRDALSYACSDDYLRLVDPIDGTYVVKQPKGHRLLVDKFMGIPYGMWSEVANLLSSFASLAISLLALIVAVLALIIRRS